MRGMPSDVDVSINATEGVMEVIPRSPSYVVLTVSLVRWVCLSCYSVLVVVFVPRVG